MQFFYDRFIRIPLPFDLKMYGENFIDIYYYAIIITTGMILSIFITGWLFKHKGIHRDNALDYALIVFPCAIVGARLYFLIFPYSDSIFGTNYSAYVSQWVKSEGGINWSYIVNTRGGGLGVYGGIILSYFAGVIMTKAKGLSVSEVADCSMPSVILAQSIGRWGNFINGEAFGNQITNPAWQWFPAAVQVDGQWFQATFFYESAATFAGFWLCLWLLKRKNYRNGLVLGFYGLYYGTVRLIIEGLRTDSLFLIIPDFFNKTMLNTGIRISQAVSVICVVLGALRIITLYWKEIKGFLRNIFKGKQKEVN